MNRPVRSISSRTSHTTSGLYDHLRRLSCASPTYLDDQPPTYPPIRLSLSRETPFGFWRALDVSVTSGHTALHTVLWCTSLGCRSVANYETCNLYARVCYTGCVLPCGGIFNDIQTRQSGYECKYMAKDTIFSFRLKSRLGCLGANSTLNCRANSIQLSPVEVLWFYKLHFL